MKKNTFLTCVVCLVCMLCLAGCSTKDNGKDSDLKSETESKPVEQTATPTVNGATPGDDGENTSVDSTSGDDEGNASVDSTPVATAPAEDPASDIIVDEDALYDAIEGFEFKLVNPDDVIVETENFRVTYLGLKYTPEAVQAEFQFLVENLSETEKIHFSSAVGMLNGWYAPSNYGSGIVNPGDRAVPSLIVDCNDLIERGITTIDKAQFWFAASRMHDATSTFTYCETYPTGLTSEEIIIPERRTEKTEKVVFDNKFLKYVIMNTEYNSDGDFVINVYLENKTKDFMYVGPFKTYLNGIEISALYNGSLFPYARNYDTIKVYKKNLEANNITSVSDIEMMIRCTNGKLAATLYFDKSCSYKVAQ